MQGLTLAAITTTEKTLYCVYLCKGHWSMKCRSMAQCHSVKLQILCSKSMSRTITMQGLALTATRAAEKLT